MQTSSPSIKTNRLYLYSIIALVVFIWGTGYPLMNYAIYQKGFPAEWMPAVRTTLPALAVTAYLYMRGLKLPPLKDKRWFWFALMGFFGMTAPFYLIAKGFELGVESGMASILVNGAMPLFTIILAHFFVRAERLSWRVTIGFITGTFGVIVLFLPEDLNWSFIDNWSAQGVMLSVGLSYALAAIVAKRAPETPASIGAAIMLITASITALMIAAPSGLPTNAFPSGVIIALFALSIIYTGVSDILYLEIIKRSGPSMIGKINYIIPVFTVIFGILFLHEGFSWRTIAAMMIIITGLLIARISEEPNDGK
ncbi:MAG: hypothetical protein COA43_11685 [Robiginitomaculum sp.]|nr:MAG: hypothetical protein COA43_11685 [Robiginitomaculum sp.]